MRATWIVLAALGVVPAVGFWVLEAWGVTDSLIFISTTTWVPGSPSVGDLAGMGASLVCWIWLRLMMPVFLLACLPFVAGDIRRVIAARRKGEVGRG